MSEQSLRSLLPKKLPESTQRAADLRDGRVVTLAGARAGEAVFSEKPIVIAPMLKKGFPSCFGCCRVVSRPLQCGGCGVPLCRTACAASPYHRDECGAMQRCGYRYLDLSMSENEGAKDVLAYQQLGVIALRLLLKGEESGWGALHGDMLKTLPKHELPEMFSLVWRPLLLFDPERAMHAWNVANSNTMGFDRRLKGRAGVCVARVSPRVGHSCVPNASFHFWMPGLEDTDPASMDKLRLVFSATVDVAAGDEVTMDIGDPLMSNVGRYRQAKDKEPKGWVCRCPRCRDGTDFALFVGSPCCLVCRDLGVQSLMVPVVLRGGRVGRQPAQRPPDDDWLVWQCRTCKKRPTRHADQGELFALHKKCYDIGVKLSDWDDVDSEDNLLELERILEEELYPRGLMHPTFFIVLATKFRLCTDELLGRTVNVKASRVRRLPDDVLRRLEGHCRDVLRALEALQLGLHWKRGLALLGFSLLLRDKAQRSVAVAPPSEATMEILDESERALRGALQCLRWRRFFWPVLLGQVDALEHTRAVMGWLRLLPQLPSVQPSPPQDVSMTG